ncbi:hypothetical protein D5086_025205 [Populus alba]|uniref:Uncharacterized protein n=1 Tax=Populus alba TaxID=43335 RepID=A0ACC4B892_POPAL
MEYATEPGAGTRSGVSWKNLAIRLLAPTLKVFDEYNAPLTRLLSNLPDNEQHLKGLISASISGPYMEQGDPDVSEYGEVADLGYGMGIDQPPTSIIIKEEFQKRLLYHMSTREDTILASMLLRPGPVRALKGARFERGKDANSVRYLNVSSIKVSVTRSCFSILLDIRKWKTTGSGSFGSVWGSFFFFSIVFKLTESARCSANYKIKLSGAVVVSQSEVVEYCKPGGCVEHVYYVLKCIHYVKRDFWFANKATVLDINRTNSQACATKSGLNTTIFTSSGMKTLQKAYMSSLSSLLALAFITIFNM